VSGDIVARLRAQRAQMRAPKRITVPVRGWNGMLYVRYRALDWERINEFVNGGVAAEEALERNLDIVIDACDALMTPAGDTPPDVQRDADGRVTLADALRAQGENVHGEIRFDEVAADVLDLGPQGSARECALALFDGAPSPPAAVARHANKIVDWILAEEEEVSETLLGESPPAAT
jgi:hypothetical protein